MQTQTPELVTQLTFCSMADSRLRFPGRPFVFDWPANGRLEVPAGPLPVSQAYLLKEPGQRLLMEAGTKALTIHVPPCPRGAVATVVVLELGKGK